MSFSLCLAVFVGGGMGALARFALSRVSTSLAASFPSLPPFPWMTLTANILGAILIGIVVGAAWHQGPWGPLRAAVLKTGFCGGGLAGCTRQLPGGSACCRGAFQNRVDEKVNNDME